MNSSSDIYHTPTLLYLICAMSAMAFVVCAYRWLWQTYRRRGAVSAGRFETSIWRGQIFSFLFVMILSITIGLYDFYVYGSPIQVYGEFLILGAFFALSFAVGKSNRLRRVLSVAREVLLLGCLCLVAWALTIGAGLLIAELLKLVSVIERADFNVVVIFMAGALWNVPILWGYHRVLRHSQTRGALQGRGFHKFLWPVLLAYIVVLIPLMMQDISNSEKWHEMQNAKPVRQI